MIRLNEISIYGVHGMNATYRLDDKTAFSGSNGAGKSTVLKSIQWALLGYIPGTTKTNTGVFQHAVGNRMSVKLLLDVDGVSVSVFRQLIKSGSSIVATFEVTPEEYTKQLEDIIKRVELPTFNFNEFAGMTANKLKDWFIDYLPKSDVDVDWQTFIQTTVADAGLAALPGDVLNNLLTDIKMLSATYSGVELIRKVNEILKTRVSVANAESKRIASTLQSLVVFDSDSELSAVTAKLELDRAQSNRLMLEVQHRDMQYNAEIEDKIAALNLPGTDLKDDPEYLGASNEFNNAQQSIESIQATIQSMDTNLRMLVDNRRDVTRFADGICPLFPNEVPCACIQQAQAAADEHLPELNRSIEALEAEIKLNQEYKTEQVRRADAMKSKIAHLSNQYTIRDNLARAIRPIRDTSDIVPQSIEYWTEEINRLNRLIGQLENNELFTRLQNDKFNVDNQLAAYKVLEKATGVNGLQTKLDSPFIRLIKNMDADIRRLLGDMCAPEFVIADKANSFSFGILRNGEYIPYDMLSSGEKTLYCLALLAALCRVNQDIKLMLIDDLFDHLDTANYIKAVQWMTDAADIQFIVAGVSSWNATEFLTHAVYNYIPGVK